MKRRKFLTGVVGLGASSALTLGSGAFSSVEAHRSVSVETSDDEDAFLALDPLTNSSNPGIGRSFTLADGTVGFSIPGTFEGGPAEGVGVDSVYTFPDLLSVKNQGTNRVELYSTYSGDNLNDLALANDGSKLRDSPPVLKPGDSVNVGLYIDTQGLETGEFHETLTIVAKKPDE